jgi:hypothetical protein
VSDAEVIAQRSDQLGGRLGSLCNAAALADLYKWRFGLVWPHSKDDAINDLCQLFAPSFLAAHQLDEHDLDGRTAIICNDVATATRDRETLLATHPDRQPFLDVANPFEILTAQVEDDSTARARFRRAFAMVRWAEPLQPVLEFCGTWAQGERWTGVHVRAGDTVIGPWRNGMWHEKYLPASCLGAALVECQREDAPVLLCSDHPQYAAWLQTRYGHVRSADDVLPRLDRLTPTQRAFAEILLLSRCDRIVGPPRSAFSTLAAMLGCGTVTRCDDLCPEGTNQIAVEASIAEMEAAGALHPYLRPFVARDACWWADVYADVVDAPEMLRLLRRATRADSEFAAAWARRARTAARLGRAGEARSSSRQAQVLADADQRHDDPSVDALAARVVTETCGTLGPVGFLVPATVARRLRLAGAAAADCRTQRPDVMRLHKISDDLDALVTTAGEIVELPFARRLFATWRLRASLRRPLADHALGSRHPAGARRAMHRSESSFDPVPEDVAVIRRLFSAALERSRYRRRAPSG